MSHSKWLSSVLQHHSAYLMSIPQCSELLGPIFAKLEARTKNYAALMHLKGKLDIITKQIAGVKDEEAAGGAAGEAVDKEALLGNSTLLSHW